jgi:hypothetical protein
LTNRADFRHIRAKSAYTPTSASWFHQVEGFLGILGKQSLSMTDFALKQALRDHLKPNYSPAMID